MTDKHEDQNEREPWSHPLTEEEKEQSKVFGEWFERSRNSPVERIHQGIRAVRLLIALFGFGLVLYAFLVWLAS